MERYQGPFNKTLSNKVLIIGNKVGTQYCRCGLVAINMRMAMQADPITPFRQAQALAEMMGDNAVLIQQAGFGVRCSVCSQPCATIHALSTPWRVAREQR